MPVALTPLCGPSITPFIDALAELRILIFRSFPYLYDGTLAYEHEYLKHYASEPTNLCVIAQNDGQVIGASTAMWLKHADVKFQACFSSSPIAVEDIFYFGESLLLPEFRGQGLGHRFFDYREQHARTLGASHTTFCAVERPLHHPMRPENYQSLEPFWQSRGYQLQASLSTLYQWRDITENEETSHTMRFWLKQL